MQSIEDATWDRTRHVWRRLRKGEGSKCVLCGGVSHNPTDSGLCERYDALTDDDRRLCPMRPTLPHEATPSPFSAS